MVINSDHVFAVIPFNLSFVGRPGLRVEKISPLLRGLCAIKWMIEFEED